MGLDSVAGVDDVVVVVVVVAAGVVAGAGVPNDTLVPPTVLGVFTGSGALAAGVVPGVVAVQSRVMCKIYVSNI